MSEPIIASLLDTDLQVLVMAQVIWKRHKDVPVTYAFKNRSPLSCPLPLLVGQHDLRREFDHIASLRFTDDELDYLRESEHVPFGMFSSDFLDFLAGMRMQDYRLSAEGDQYRIEVEGPWARTIFWQIPILSVMNELQNRSRLFDCGRTEDQAERVGETMLDAKLQKLCAEAPAVRFAEFGTRRRFSRRWQDKVNGIILSRAPQLLSGISNVALARKYGVPPIGTMAHEMYMVYSGIYHGSDDEIRGSHNKVLQSWYHEYGIHLSIALTDTYGSEFFFKDMTADQARHWRGLRQDSGDPFAFGERAIEFYKGHGIDPAGKLVVFSDGLDVEKIIGLHKRFDGRIKTSFGWGTDLTNDCGVTPLSMVVKAVRSCGHPTVKLSDNLAKATGPAEEVERFKRIFGYAGDSYEACRV